MARTSPSARRCAGEPWQPATAIFLALLSAQSFLLQHRRGSGARPRTSNGTRGTSRILASLLRSRGPGQRRERRSSDSSSVSGGIYVRRLVRRCWRCSSLSPGSTTARPPRFSAPSTVKARYIAIAFSAGRRRSTWQGRTQLGRAWPARHRDGRRLFRAAPGGLREGWNGALRCPPPPPALQGASTAVSQPGTSARGQKFVELVAGPEDVLCIRARAS